jgi:hypothetical protein
VTEILAATMERFPDWRQRCALMAAEAERPGNNAEQLTEGCAAIRAEVQDARTDILLALADTPPRLAGHSRVVDVERALDSVETAVAAVERRLLRH